MPEAIVTGILRLAGYTAYELEETTSRLTLWVRQMTDEPYHACGGCGIASRDVHSWRERRVRDLPWGPWQVWLVIEVHRVRCPRCGVRTERLPFVTGKAPYTTRVEATIARDCEAAPVSRVAPAWQLPPETVRRLDKRVLRRSAAERPPTPLRFLGVDEIYLGRRDKFLTIVSDLDTGEPLWAGRDRKRETLDRFFAEVLPLAVSSPIATSRSGSARWKRSTGTSGRCSVGSVVTAITSICFSKFRRRRPHVASSGRPHESWSRYRFR
jgi:transposase